MNWITLEGVSAGDWHHRVLTHLDWTWKPGESWLVTGPNGSGKSALVALLVGRLDAMAGRMERHPAFSRAEEAWIGFERQRLLLEWERHIDLTDVMDSPDPGTLVTDFIGDPAALQRFGLEGKGSRGLKHLSTGELRRACLARAAALELPFLILDEPFEGLDADGSSFLAQLIASMRQGGTDLLFLSRRPDDAPGDGWFTWELAPWPRFSPGYRPVSFSAPSRRTQDPVLEFCSVEAGYPGVPVLRSFTWTVNRGDRWLVTGPNGSGKSTLLSLISGDHPQVFSNEIRLFGVRRGPDLTLAEVRRRVALVSYSAHLAFRNLFGVTGLEVLASGFAGTVGLWADPSWDQIEACRHLAQEWGLAEAVSRYWEDLSWGTQRLFVLGRALIGGAEVLLLDEPCQGLDGSAQHRFLNRVAAWAADPRHSLIYVTHRADEVNPAEFLRLQLPVSAPGDAGDQPPG